MISALPKTAECLFFNMRILLVGEIYKGAYSELLYNNFVKLGIETEVINTHNLFKTSLINRVLNKFLKTPHYFGFGVRNINKIVLEKASIGKFDFILFIKPILIYPKTIINIKKNTGGRAKIIGLTLDPPDIFNYNSDFFYESMQFFDLYVVGRREDGEMMYKYGAKKVYWFLFGADASCHYPINISGEDKERLGADIVFLGSYTKGEKRVEYMERLCQEGYDVKIYGNSWNNLSLNSCLRRKNKIIPGGTPCEEMAKIIGASKIILAFMRDVMEAKIGMRTFEIPLCKGFMLHQRTKESEEFLAPDKEAVFFSDYKEMKEKIDFYLSHSELRDKIAEAGYKKVLNCDSLNNNVMKKLVSILKNEISDSDVLAHKPIKVAISVIGRFHLFNLAQQLLKKKYLHQLITSYPKFEVVKYGIPKDKISSIIIKEIIHRGWQKLPNFLKEIYNPQYLIHEIFDKIATLRLRKGANIVLVSGLHTLKKAKKNGALTIVERGSSHILYQNKILKEEYEKFGVKIKPFTLPHPKIIENELKSYKEVDYISIPSLFVKRTFLEYGFPESKLIHIPYGVDLSDFRQIPKNDDIFRVVFAGGMTLRKGVHYLLQAFAELNLPNSELTLIGAMNDEMKPFFKKYEGKFNYIGHIPQKELYKYYSQGSVFVMPSIEEGLSMVQLQAMACGLSLICTTNTGGEDVVEEGKTGFVIPIRDVEALKEKLLYLYKNPEICRQMGQSAKERVASGFTWDDYGDKMMKAYEKIIRK